jgi:hypothetical protein
MKEILSSIKELEAVRARQIESHMALMDNLEKQKKNLQDNLLANCGLNEGDIVTLKLYEHRDDTVSCFQTAREVDLRISRIYIQKNWDESKHMFTYDDAFLCPVLHAPLKSGKSGSYKKTPYAFNQFLHWELYKDGRLVMGYKSEQKIIEDKYTEEELIRLREHLGKIQSQQ